MGDVDGWKVASGNWSAATSWIDGTSDSDSEALTRASGETTQIGIAGTGAVLAFGIPDFASSGAVPELAVRDGAVRQAGMARLDDARVQVDATALARTLQWNAADGLWSSPANWTDVTGSIQPAQSAPGDNDTVNVTGSGAEILISGPGTAASLSIAGSVALDGRYIAGVVAFLPYNAATDSVARLHGGTVLLSNQVTVASNLELSGAGTSLDVTGTLALGTDGPLGSPSGPVTIGQITLADHAMARVDTLDLGGYFGLSTILIGGLTIDATSALEVGRTGGAAAGALTVDAGHTVTLGADIQADIVNNGGLIAEGFSYLVPRVVGAVSGSGFIRLTSALFEFGGGVDFAGAVGAGQTISFGGPNQLLRLEAPGSFAATITGFTRAGTIALPAAITSVSFAPSGTGGVLSLFAGGVAAGSLAFAGAEFAAAGFSMDMVGGEAILSTNVPCFAAGTRIATSRDLVVVEALRPGDMVRNPWGELLAVRWLGHRQVDCRRHPRPHDVLPIRVSAGAFGPDMPERDLHLSPDHAVFSDGMLVPVRYLLNGATVVQRDVADVTYWHVELERHDVLLAEGLPCESYLDTGNRAAFANGGPVVTLHAAFAGAWDSMACGRLVTEGPELAVLRARLFERALAMGHRVTAEAALHLALPGGRVMPRRAGRWYGFRFPAGGGVATLRSRSVVPAEMWPGHGDHRRLGVAVPRLRLDGKALPLDHPRLGKGWHVPEPGLRWTGGAGEIDLTGARHLAVEAPALLEYWEEASISPAGRSGSRHSRL